MDASINELVGNYFHLGLRVKQIRQMLIIDHEVELSERQIKRKLKALDLTRREYSSPIEVVEFVQDELRKSGQLHGYRMMYSKCINAGLNVRMEDIRHLIRQLDPERVDMRRTGRLQRRNYHVKGPNFIWHVDGYDKIKPYGICIHGCIDGYSRKIIWLNCYHTNNNPRVIGSYFLEAVRECGGCPVMVRGDYGTENGHIRDFMHFLRRSGTDGNANMPYLDGASTMNQRIECWWGFLRKECIQFWMDHFADLKDRGNFGGDQLDKALIQFCFMAIIQGELDKIADIWNLHSIRPSRNGNSPSGKPGQMYSMPALWGAEDQMRHTEEQDLRDCSQEVQFRTTVPCDPDIYERCLDIMARDNISPASNTEAATDLYLHLREELGRQ